MIDFKKKRYQGISHRYDIDEMAILEQYTVTIRRDLDESKMNFFYLGVHLIDLWRSNAYASVVGIKFNYESVRTEYGFKVPIGAGNCCADFFFAYCYDEFGLDKTQVSRYMNIADEFGDAQRGFADQWKRYSYSQLCELLPLTTEQRKPITPDWTIKRIREYKKSLVATSQQNDEETQEAEEPPQEEKYIRFEKWTKRELCDKIIDLEAEREMLLQEIENLRNPAADKEPFDDFDGLPPILKSIAG